MTYLVPDASVAVKWFVPEIHEDAANRWARHGFDLLAPAHFQLEIAAALLKKVRSSSDDLTAEAADTILQHVTQMPVEIRPNQPLLLQAFDLAIRHARSIHDALYLALALHTGCQFVTADRKFYDATAPSYPATLLWVADIPPA